MLSERRNTAAARRFLKNAIQSNGAPERIVIDQSGANLAGIEAVNVIRKIRGMRPLIQTVLAKHLNNIVEQDHRFGKRITRPTMRFKAFHSAAATLDGIEAAHMIRKDQIIVSGQNGFQKFAALAG